MPLQRPGCYRLLHAPRRVCSARHELLYPPCLSVAPSFTRALCVADAMHSRAHLVTPLGEISVSECALNVPDRATLDCARARHCMRRRSRIHPVSFSLGGDRASLCHKSRVRAATQTLVRASSDRVQLSTTHSPVLLFAHCRPLPAGQNRTVPQQCLQLARVLQTRPAHDAYTRRSRSSARACLA